ncbi:MAG: hypothetical protein HC819_13555 [Cyclobacteriaceae bacterium]|nr:hypothetical protein [Cyclobacteriaceae bacterium]
MKNFITNKLVFRYGILLAGFALLFISSCNDESDEIGSAASMSMKTMPKVHYVIGETLDLSSMVITEGQGSAAKDIPYASFASEGIICEPENGTTLTFDHESLIVKNTKTGAGLTQDIDVTNSIAAMVVKTPPLTDYFTGELLDLTGLVVEATLENGNKIDIPLDELGQRYTVTPPHGQVLAASNDQVKITHIATNVSTMLPLSVTDFIPTSAMVVSGPAKSSYNIGEKMALDGLVVKYETTAGITKEIAAANFDLYGISTSPADKALVGVSTSAIQIVHQATGVNTFFDLEVIPLEITAMSIKFKPNKTLYEVGQAIDLSGLILTLSVPGSSSIEVEAANFDIYGIVTDPAQGETYTSSMSEIVISYPGYGSTLSIALGSEIIYESDFANAGTASWFLGKNDGGSGKLLVENGNLVVKDIVKGAYPWSVQLMIPDITIEKGSKYKYTIVSRKYDPGVPDYWLTVSIGDGDGRDGWGAYDGGDNGIWFAANAWQTVTKEFVMGKETTDKARLVFEIGGNAYPLEIQYVKIEKL